MSRIAQWMGRIFLDAGTILYVGPGGIADRHSHHAVQLVRSSNGPFSLSIGDRHFQKDAALIPAQEPHAIDASNRVIALLLVEPHGVRGRELDTRAREAAGRDLTSIGFPALDLDAKQAAAWTDATFGTLGGSSRPALSSVSRRAIEFVESRLDGVPRLTDAAKSLRLSPTRLTHVFTAEVGIPFRRFVLWTRIKRAVTETQAGKDLTAAAVSAGFSDSAHFSRTFRAMFGLSPSLVLPVAQITGTIWASGMRDR